MNAKWLSERLPRTGRVLGGEHAGAEAIFEPEDRDATAWHIYIKGGSRDAAYDIWADDAEQVVHWIENWRIELD